MCLVRLRSRLEEALKCTLIQVSAGVADDVLVTCLTPDLDFSILVSVVLVLSVMP
jgi:hypothetical protein